MIYNVCAQHGYTIDEDSVNIPKGESLTNQEGLNGIRSEIRLGIYGIEDI